MTIDVAALPAGLHWVGVRYMDSNGTWSGVNWSCVQKGDFEITDPAVTPQALAKDTGVAQVDLLHIGVPNAGDDYNATVNGVTVSVTAQP